MPPQTLTHSLTKVSGDNRDNDEPVTDECLSKSAKYSSIVDNYTSLTQAFRAILIMITVLSIIFKDSIQLYMDSLWAYLKTNPVFCSAYFETGYVTVVYVSLIAICPFAMHYMPFLAQFKVSGDVTYVHQPVIGMIRNLVIYLGPLLAADAVIMKRYWDVPESEWAERRQQWIQTTRALPAEAPPFFLMCASVAASVVVFDALFFAVHYALHKNMFLYKYFHAVHHDHSVMHPHVTNQLSLVERLLLIASANYALKIFRCHPLTRVAFVPVFLWLLIENHTGYDLPWAPHRLAPPGLMGGPAKHHAHHLNGGRNYQPFFNYLDNWLDSANKNNKEN